jgi:hypothetical protein
MNFIGVASCAAPIFVVILQNLSPISVDKRLFICYISGIISSAVVFVAIQQPCLWRVHIALLQKKL